MHEGRYNNGAKDGRGKLKYPDGRTFQLDFINRVQQGKEILINEKKAK